MAHASGMNILQGYARILGSFIKWSRIVRKNKDEVTHYETELIQMKNERKRASINW